MLQRLRELAYATPLSGFLVLGGLLYALAMTFLPLGRERFVIDVRTIDGVLESRADRVGRDLTAEERDAAVQDHIDEEILLREAHRRGIHLRHSPSRSRLIRRMRLELTRGLPTPSRAQLRAYYRTNAARYQTGESVTFTHAFFSSDSPARPDTDDVLRALNAGADGTTIGERFWLGHVLERVDRDRLAVGLGDDFASSVFALPPERWSGPIESSRGVHFVMVLERHAPRVVEFDIVEPTVMADWMVDKRDDVTDRRMGRIRDRYRVRVDR